MDEARSDAEIVARTYLHPELFGLLFDRHFATVYRYLERRVGRDDADELSGEVFRIAFEQRALFRPLHESALPWLYGLATNLLLKHWRRESRYLRALARLRGEAADVDSELDLVERRIAARASGAEVLAALRILPSRDRDVLVLIAWEELSYEEVAVALGIPVGTVRSRLNRARRRLRELVPAIGNESAMVTCEHWEGLSNAG